MGTTPWFLRSARVRRVATVALVVDLGLGAFFTAMAVAAGSASAADTSTAAATTSSAVTVRWTDDRAAYNPDYDASVDATCDPAVASCDRNQSLFEDLEVTVSQTQDLTDQGLRVSWTGGKPTPPNGAASNFLQIMQCWAGPGATGPEPEQCQWGTPNASLAPQVGTRTGTRELMTADAEADPNQPLSDRYKHAQFGQSARYSVPFWSVDDPGRSKLGWVTDDYNQPPFNPAQSNEVTYARTASDGTGQYIVNLQSALSAPYLGCGNPTLAKAGNTCWLVVVPRGEYNVSGARAVEHDDDLPQNPQYVAGSPLSASAWRDRIQVKLGFSPIGASCRIGSSEVPTAGSELVAGALGSWTSALCAKGTTLGYSQIGDGQARSTLLSGMSGAPGLTFMTDPVDPENAGDATIAYAPVATSGLVVSYLIDKNYSDDPTNPDLAANGTLVNDLRLTPLLVAKLLTQSYRADVPGRGANSQIDKDNPVSLRTDPEFLALNPNFKYFFGSAAPDGLIVPFGDTDAARAVWAWLRSDDATRRFLGGQKVGGVTINPAYLDLDLGSDSAVASFPKADPAMFQTGDAPPPGFGTLDLRPYSANLTDGAKRTVTATAGSKIVWDITRDPPQYTGGAAQAPGNRFELAITTSQAASLYGLPTAAIVDDAHDDGPGVTATSESMAKQMTRRTATDVPGVYRVDPMRSVAGGYPLTLQTYAAVNVCAAEPAELTAYARFLDYVADAGQVSGTKLGQLPPGYAPLGSDDKAQARSVAADLRAEVAKPQCASHQEGSGTAPTSTPTQTPSTTTGTGSTPTPQPPAAEPAITPAVPPAATAPAVPAASAEVADASALGITPVAHVSPAARYAIVAALLFALPCLIGGPSVIQGARRRG